MTLTVLGQRMLGFESTSLPPAASDGLHATPDAASLDSATTSSSVESS